MDTDSLQYRDIHNKSYDFELLIKNESSLEEFVFLNKYNILTIDFSDSLALIALNKALLKTYYNIKYWDIPNGFLCPPIPSRADYIHNLSDLLEYNKNIKVLDIGCGANCIYPLLGSSIYNWDFTCSDISQDSLNNVNNIIKNNNLQNKIKTIFQKEKHKIFDGIINKDDKFDLTMCNPPFYSSQEDAKKANNKKNKNLNIKNDTLNFGGISNELWCKNGEAAFIKKMIKQSVVYKNNVLWFSTLVSKQENLKDIQKQLKRLNASDVKIVQMKRGNKTTRFVAWTFLSEKEQNLYKK